MIRTTTTFALLALLVASSPSLARESGGDSDDEIHPLLTNGFTVDIGVFFPRRSLDLSVTAYF